MKSNAKPLMPSAPKQAAPLFGGNKYRVRLMEVRLVIDVYDKDGNLIGRPTTDPPFVLAETDFPAELCKLIAERTDVKDGFAVLAAGPKAVEKTA